MVKPAPGGGGGTGRSGVLLLALFVSGCAGGGPSYSQLPPPSYDNAYFDLHVHVPMAPGFPAAPASSPSSPPASYQAPAFGQGQGGGCGLAGRFDNGSALSYNFSDQSQIGLNMGVNHDGAGMLGISHAIISFRYKFDPVKPHHDEKCRYASHWHGLVGSAYNELVLRDHNTVWGEIKDRGLDFWNK